MVSPEIAIEEDPSGELIRRSQTLADYDLMRPRTAAYALSMRKLVCIFSSVLLTIGLAGCTASSAEPEEASTPVEQQEVVPEPEILETFALGEIGTLPSAEIVVNEIESREVITTGSYSEDYVPGDGESLWYFDISWTNLNDEAVAKECHGPYSVDLSAYDVNGVEMLMVDQPGYIEGQNCSTGLMKGQTGKWLSAFRGLDSDFGWAVFSDSSGAEMIVTLDPSLELSRG